MGEAISPRFQFISKTGASAKVSRPAPAKVIAGDPVFTTWTLEEANGLFAGLWQATPGKWRIADDQWEYCRIIEGVSVVTEEGGAAHILRAGDAFVIRPGFIGTWEVIETTLKDYVIRLPEPPAGPASPLPAA